MDEDVQKELGAHVDRIVELERIVLAWERWAEGIYCDFSGLMRGDDLHDWDWIDEHRPPPKSTPIELDDEQ